MRHVRPRPAHGENAASLWGRVDIVSWLTLYLIALFAIPSRLVIAPLGSAGALSMLFGLASVGAWVLWRIGWARPHQRSTDPIGVVLLLFLLSVGISYALAMSRPIMSDEVSPADVALLSLLSWTGILLLAREIPTRVRLNEWVWRLSVAGGVLGLLGVAQFLTRRVLVDVIAVPGLTAMSEATTYLRDGRIRPSGTSIHPLEYGAILSILLPLALHVAMSHRSRNLVLRWAPALAIGCAIAVSSSRTAYLTGVLGTAIAMVGLSKRHRSIILGMGVLGGVSLLIIAPRLVNSVANLFTGAGSDPSVESRTDSFSVAGHFLGQWPYFGHGLGTFLGKYRIFDNQFLLLLVSVGIVGTLLYTALYLIALVQATRVFLRAADPTTRALAMALAGAVAAGFLSQAFFDAFAFPMTMGAVFLVLGTVASVARNTLSRDQEPARYPVEEVR